MEFCAGPRVFARIHGEIVTSPDRLYLDVTDKATEGFKSEEVLCEAYSSSFLLCSLLNMRMWLITISAALATSIVAFPEPNRGAVALGKRQIFENGSSSLTVDLGYEQYQGVIDGSSGLKIWKGYVCLCHQDRD